MSKIKTISFNLRMDNPSDPLTWKDRWKIAQAIIRKESPDLIGLQEVQKHMLKDVEAELAGDYYLFAEFRSLEDGTESTPVLAKKDRFELLKQQSFMLSETPDIKYSKSWDSALERIASLFVLKDKLDAEKFVFINTHFDNAGSEARYQSALLCRNFIEQVQDRGLNCILTGDLNAYPDEKELKPLIENENLANSYYSLTTEKRENALSFHDYKGGQKGKPIDHIFITKPWTFENIEFLSSEYQGYYPSDHYPLLANIDK